VEFLRGFWSLEMPINGESERTTYTRDQLLCLRTLGPELGQCVRTFVDSLINTRRTIRGCRGGQHRRPAPVYTDSGSTGVRIISGNRPIRRPLSQSQSANIRDAPVQPREPVLICPRISRHAIQRSRLTRFGCLNIRSVNNKIDDVRLLMQEEKLHVLALTETWHEDSDCTTIKRLRGLGLNVLETARPIDDKRRQAKAKFVNHGGIAIVATQGVALSKIELRQKTTTFEYMCCRTTSGGSSHILVVVYRPGSQPTTTAFFDEFSALLATLASMSVPITITGDMNVNLEQALDPEAVKYSTILSTYNFRQHVKTSTHRSGSLLDHVITPESAFPPDVLITDVGLSDHMLLSWSINMTPPSPTYVTITRRKWQHFDAGAFLAELSKSELCADSEPATDISADVDHLAAMFNSEIIGLLGKHAPVAEFTVRERAHQPWFDSECREARRKARRLARRCQTNAARAEDKQAWRKALRAARKLSHQKASDYWKSKITSAGTNRRHVWQSVNQLLGDGKNTTKAGSFSAATYHDHMEKKIADIRASASDANEASFASCQTPGMCEFHPITTEDVIKVIASSPSKQCSLDVLPTWLMKEATPLLAPFIARMFNHSFAIGRFPSTWKHAIVKPLLKQAGAEESSPANFRPVSNLSFISKVLERIANKQLTEYLSGNRLLPRFQSAYRRGHSTETALLKVFSDVVNAIDSGQLALLSLLDMSAAFDTVDHDILMQ